MRESAVMVNFGLKYRCQKKKIGSYGINLANTHTIVPFHTTATVIMRCINLKGFRNAHTLTQYVIYIIEYS
jgi:hypothetical protein